MGMRVDRNMYAVSQDLPNDIDSLKLSLYRSISDLEGSGVYHLTRVDRKCDRLKMFI